MSEKRYYVDRSEIHGKGLFAAKDIKKGTLLGRAKGYKTRRDGMHVLWLDDSIGFRVECDLRFINHSDKPNAVYYDTLEVCAIRNIKAGEEITHDYGGIY